MPFGVIFCGGQGTRLADILPDGVPKPLLEVAGGETMLDTIVRQQRRAGIGQMLIVASDQNADAIRSHCRRNAVTYDGVGVAASTVQDKQGLGSVLSGVSSQLPADRPLYKTDGDVLHFRFNPQAFVRFHQSHDSGSTALVTRRGAWKHFAAMDTRTGRIYATDTDVRSGAAAFSLTGTVIIGASHRQLVSGQPDTGSMLRTLADSGQFFGFHTVGPSINVNTPDDYDAALKFRHERPLL